MSEVRKINCCTRLFNCTPLYARVGIHIGNTCRYVDIPKRDNISSNVIFYSFSFFQFSVLFFNGRFRKVIIFASVNNINTHFVYLIASSWR